MSSVQLHIVRETAICVFLYPLQVLVLNKNTVIEIIALQTGAKIVQLECAVRFITVEFIEVKCKLSALIQGILHKYCNNWLGITAILIHNQPPIFRGSKLIGQFTNQQFHGQVSPAPLLLHGS